MNRLLELLLGVLMMSAPDDHLRYLALGDSYTIGQSVAEADRWPVRLADELRQRDILINNPRIIAVTGWTTDELSEAMDRAGLEDDWDFVSLLIGVNNAYRGRDLENFRSEYSALLDRAIGLAGGRTDRVIVLSIPDWSKTPFAAGSRRNLTIEAKLMAAYNQAKCEITKARGVAYFDITPSTFEMTDHPDLVARDGLHPSGLLYRRWVDQIIDQVAALLEVALDDT